MTASLTALPVIGVPIKTKTFEGIDSLLSIIQMPGGVPVATVAVNGAKNAGLLALRMLAISDEALSNKLKSFISTQTAEVLEKAKKLEESGSANYLELLKQ